MGVLKIFLFIYQKIISGRVCKKIFLIKIIGKINRIFYSKVLWEGVNWILEEEKNHMGICNWYRSSEEILSKGEIYLWVRGQIVYCDGQTDKIVYKISSAFWKQAFIIIKDFLCKSVILI